MSRTRFAAACLAIGLAAMAGPAYGETYYVEQDESSVSATLDVSFSASGFLKLVIFDPNGPLDFLNPRADTLASIYANKTIPSTVTGTLDADVAGSDLTLSAMAIDLLADGPETVLAGADIHVDAIPQVIVDLLDPFLDQIDPNWIDPNVIEDLLDMLLGGFDFDYDFDMTVNALTMAQTGDPVSTTLDAGAFENMNVWAEVDSEIQFNGGDPIDVPPVPLPFWLDGTYTDVPVDTLTMGSEAANGGVETPETVIIDQLITIPISGFDVTFQVQLQIDAGNAAYSIAPSLTALTGYLLTINVDPADSGTVETDIPGPEYPPGTDVALTATAAEGWNFSHWEGDLSGSDNPTSIRMDTHKTVTAVFIEGQVALTVNIDGDGRVELDPPGGLYDYGTEVTLTPIATIGNAFVNWSGDIDPGQEEDYPLVIVMDGDHEVTAHFEKSCGSGSGLPLGVCLLSLCAVVGTRRRR